MATRAPIDWQEPIADPVGRVPARSPLPETGFIENFTATRREMEIVGNTDSQVRNMEEAYRPIIEALEQSGARWGSGQHFLNPASLPEGQTSAYGTVVPGRAEMRSRIHEEIRRRRQADKGFLSEVPDTPEEFERNINERNAARLREIRGTQAGATTTGAVGGFLGGVVGAFEDPVNLWTMPFGGTSRTFVGALARSFLENAAIEAVSQPLIAQNYEALGEDIGLGDSVRSVLFSGAAGAAFRAGAEGIGAAARNAGPAYDILAEAVFNAMPEPVRRRWADSATVGDDLLIDVLRGVVPEETWTPEIRDAVNIVERDADVRAASPFVPGQGDDFHSESLAQALQKIIAGTPPIAVKADALASVAPVAARVMPAPASTPAFGNMWNAIVRIEGGTDKQGRFLTSPAGAIGPAQVMPGTAPEAARLAGVPFDNQRYRTDPEYNLLLGQAYFQEQLRTFGDPSMAAAAYNAGPGSAKRGTGVRGALAKAERAGEPDNWEKYLPRETQLYVKNFRKRAGASDDAEPIDAPVAVAQAVDNSVADAADLEAMQLARDAEAGNVPTAYAERAEVPVLRRDLFANDNDYVEAQRAVYREFNDEPIREAPIARFRRAEAVIERDMPVVEAGFTRLWRGERLGANGLGLNFTNDLSGIALPFREGYGGDLNYIDVSTSDLAKYEMTGAAAPGAEFHLPPELAKDARRAADVAPSVFTVPAPNRQITPDLQAAQVAYVGMTNERISQTELQRLRASLEAGRSPDEAAAEVRAFFERPIDWDAERADFARFLAEKKAVESGGDLAKFDDPAGEGPRLAADSIEHDLRVDLAANPELAAKTFIIDELGEASLGEILEDLDGERAAVAAIRACL